MRIGWYVASSGTALHGWRLDKRRHDRHGVRVGVESLKDAHGHTRLWRYREAAQEAADKLNREEAVS